MNDKDCMLWQAALTHSAALLADKDAEIDRLKQSISRHEIGGSKLAADNMNLQAEIERLHRVMDVLQHNLDLQSSVTAAQQEG